jgi:hypothetical protein
MRFVTLCASLLVLPLAGLLFFQWPLRECVQAYSHEANDLGQVLFALYVAVAIFAASQRTLVRRGTLSSSWRWVCCCW